MSKERHINCPEPLDSFDMIVVSTSGGKDSQAMLSAIVRAAEEAGVRQRVCAVHCDLGRVEWQGTTELAEKQCRMLGIPFMTISRRGNDLLAQVEHERKKWPSPSCRYCTSDHKTSQIMRAFTALVNAMLKAEPRRYERPIRKDGKTKTVRRRVRILDCQGLRAQESVRRSKLSPFGMSAKKSNKTKREVYEWYPIHHWSTEDVWDEIRESGLPHHYAYDLGMPRLSCAFCIFASKDALILSGKHNTELLREYVRIEKEIDHTFRQDLTLADVLAAVEADAEVGDLSEWGET